DAGPFALTRLPVAALFEAALSEGEAERVAADGLLAGLVRPGDVGLVQGARRRASLRAQTAPIADEAAEHVHVPAVGVRRGTHLLRGVKPDSLPLDPALDGPRQDPRT